VVQQAINLVEELPGDRVGSPFARFVRIFYPSFLSGSNVKLSCIRTSHNAPKSTASGKHFKDACSALKLPTTTTPVSFYFTVASTHRPRVGPRPPYENVVHDFPNPSILSCYGGECFSSILRDISLLSHQYFHYFPLLSGKRYTILSPSHSACLLEGSLQIRALFHTSMASPCPSNFSQETLIRYFKQTSASLYDALIPLKNLVFFPLPCGRTL